MDFSKKVNFRCPLPPRRPQTRGKYKALPVRRTYIDKEDGRKRALGILAIEDKIVQQAVCTILNQIYETDFVKLVMDFEKDETSTKRWMRYMWE